MKKQYTIPDKNLMAFTCPHCHTYSTIDYCNPTFEKDCSNGLSCYLREPIYNVHIARCMKCGGKIIWVNDEYVYPAAVVIEPNEDMPESVMSLYNEASSICNRSPRAACALLRLAVEKLCVELGEQGDINTMIGNMVKKGLPTSIQEALDSVRVIGNKAVHIGQIDINVDDMSTAEALMMLLNTITTYLVSEPQKINRIYGMLPSGAKESIANRDKKS